MLSYNYLSYGQAGSNGEASALGAVPISVEKLVSFDNPNYFLKGLNYLAFFFLQVSQSKPFLEMPVLPPSTDRHSGFNKIMSFSYVQRSKISNGL